MPKNFLNLLYAWEYHKSGLLLIVQNWVVKTCVMFIVGLTGGLATGKSTVLSIFRENGVAVIDADEVARKGRYFYDHFFLYRLCLLSAECYWTELLSWALTLSTYSRNETQWHAVETLVCRSKFVVCHFHSSVQIFSTSC